VSNYKNTLNLPKTTFSMRGNLQALEPKILEKWKEISLYESIRKYSKGKKKFILHDGPPYANGDIHIGHAVNKVLKDIIIKSKTLSGYDAPYIPGWDCHGLPIELQVEKKFGKPGEKISEKEFRNACRKYANKQIEKQKIDFIRLGVCGTWDTPYSSQDYTFESNVIDTLSNILSKNHIQKGSKPVHWCTACKSALAEAEVEYDDYASKAIDVCFPVIDIENFSSSLNLSKPIKNASVLIWTTTPWTLPANEAVCLHPNIDYSLIEIKNKNVLIATNLVEIVCEKYNTNYIKLGNCKGLKLENKLLQHPFNNKQVPIICGEHVTTDSGTGAVHTAPGHGLDDYVVGQKYNLPINNPVDEKGYFVEGTNLFAEKNIFDCDKEIIKVLDEKGMLMHKEEITHSYPHCWRHKAPLIFRATEQWFISMDKNKLREKSLKSINKVTWIPDWGKKRIYGMVENRPDWCISRQRKWGVPITLFVHKKTGELHPKTATLFKKAAALVKQNGIDAWFDLKNNDLLGPESEEYEKITDTLDVWFDSGVTHNCVLSKNKNLSFPADLYLEGSDQHRGWFQSSLLTSVALHGVAPYKQVLTHGFTVDAKGQKMSKSKGNVIAPQKVINKLGADILRLWVSSTDYSAEITVSDEILQRTSDAYRRIRNTTRYLLANLGDFNPETDIVEKEKLLVLDQWAINTTASLQKEIIYLYENYIFHEIYQKIHNFCVNDMGSFYLDVTKDRQYTTQPNSIARKSAQTAMFYIVNAVARWLSPIMPFTSEEIWEHLPGENKNSIFLSSWYDLDKKTNHKGPIKNKDWLKIMDVRNLVSKHLELLRNQNEIGSSLDAEVKIYCTKDTYNSLKKLGDELHFVLITSKASITKQESSITGTEETLKTGEKIIIEAQACKDEKCSRCWHRKEDVGKHKDFEDLCERCITNINGPGENRLYV